MKRAKIYIGETAKGDMKYNLYRFKNEPSRIDLDYYLDVDPIAVIDELDKNKPIEYGEIENFIPFIDDKGGGFEFVSLTAPFDFVFNQNTFKINIGHKSRPDRILEIHTNNVGISRFVSLVPVGDKYVPEFEITNAGEISKHVVAEGGSGIAVSKRYISGQEDITLNIKTKRLYHIDGYSDGVFNPKYQVIKKLKEFEIHPIVDTQHNIYHYTAVATTKEGRVSEVSNVASVLLQENPNDVNMRVECSDDYHEKGNDATWQKLDRIKSSNAYRISKDDMYSRDIPPLNTNEISVDDSNIQIYNERILKVPNIWHRDKMNLLYRRLRAYRFINDFNGYLSDYSDVFYESDFSKVEIDKMTIYKKKVTYLDEDDRNKPIEVGDKDAELLKMCVRVGGIYYKGAIEKLDYQPIELFANNSRLPIINIKDHCLYSNHYNYTIYLYDEKGKQSKPYCVVL